MGYKMVFSDMDGTLLWKGVRVSVENSAAIRKAVDNLLILWKTLWTTFLFHKLSTKCG